jgi:hypothetical protein
VWLIPIALLPLPLLAISMPERTGRLLSAVLPERRTFTETTIEHVHFVEEGGFTLPTWLDDRLRRLGIEYESQMFDVLLTVEGPMGRVFERRDSRVGFLSAPAGHSEASLSRANRLEDAVACDLDGDAIPDLVVESYSGGAHCCYTFSVLRLGERPALLGQIEFENGASFDRRFVGNSVETIITSTDSVWNYWKSCYACTFKPEIILRLKNGSLSLAPDLMAKPLPADIADIESRMREIISVANFSLEEAAIEPADYWHFVVQLIYTGHEKEAIDLIRRTWTENVPERELFIAELIGNFESSPWAAALRRHFGN